MEDLVHVQVRRSMRELANNKAKGKKFASTWISEAIAEKAAREDEQDN